MEQVLIFLVMCSIAPAWWSLLRQRGLSRRYRVSVGLVSVSALLQVGFIVGVGSHLITLDYSLRFFAIGGPCAVVAILLVLKEEKAFVNSKGAPISSAAALFCGCCLLQFISFPCGQVGMGILSFQCASVRLLWKLMKRHSVKVRTEDSQRVSGRPEVAHRNPGIRQFCKFQMEFR